MTLATPTARPRPDAAAAFRSFDDPATPLHDVTFVVVDLETTGGSPAVCEITEIGAVKYRGGECLGTFQTLVDPGVPIPPLITVLTGITDAMVLAAPPIREVLPALIEFAGGAVLVGHNLRFDTAFLDAALVRYGYPRIANRRVVTLGLARRLVRDDVENHKLATLARHFGASVVPSHRALDDASATAEVLHSLIEVATAFGVLGLDDLLELPRIRVHPSTAKLALTASLPREPGVYLFRDRAGNVLHVGRATNVRGRVRAYFRGGRAVPQLLRETAAIEHIGCASDLEAAVRELRLIRDHRPRHNRRIRVPAYVMLTLRERIPRVAVVRNEPTDGSVHLGPLPSTAWAHRVKDAIEAAVPLRRCANRINVREPRCCRCGGSLDTEAYGAVVQHAVAGITGGGHRLVDTLTAQVVERVGAGDPEGAAVGRDRIVALTAALDRMRRLETLRRAGRIRARTSDGTVVVDRGRLVLDDDQLADADTSDASDEVLLIGRWLDRVSSRGGARIDEVTGELDSESAEQVMEIIDDAWRRRGLTVLFVTHNRELAARAGRRLRLEGGEVVDA